jgi:hypothetical protein
MVGEKMAFLDSALLLPGQPLENLAQMLPQLGVKLLTPILGNENRVVLALSYSSI